MQKNFLALFLILAFPLYSKATTAEKEITGVISSLAKSMNEKNIESVMDAWMDDGEKFTLAGGIYRGKTQLRELYYETFSNPFQNARYDFVIQYIRLNDQDNAVVDGVWKTYEAGPPSYPACGIFLFHLIRSKLGWKLKLSMATVPRLGHTANHGRSLSWIKTCSEHREEVQIN